MTSLVSQSDRHPTAEERFHRPRFPSNAIVKVLRSAIARVPYYRTRLTSWEAVTSLDYKAFSEMPHLTKDHLQSSKGLKHFIAEDSSDELMRYEWTSGSSGKPLICAKSHEERMRLAWSAWQVRRWWCPSIIGKPAAAFGATWNGQAHRAGRDLRLSVSDVSDETMDYFGRRLREFKPYWMYGIPSAIYHLASYFRDRPRYKPFQSPRLIELQGEYLPAEYQSVIREVFNGRISNQYGCHELWVMAYSCPRGSLHILENDVFLEIVDRNGTHVPDGVMGQVIVTSLLLKAMPFIRYELGDRAKFVPGPCVCGRPLRRIELAGCRQSQIFRTRDGRRFDGLFFLQTLNQGVSSPLSEALKTYQIVQKSHRLIEFYYEPGRHFQSQGYPLFRHFVKTLREAIDQDLEIEFVPRRYERHDKKWNFLISELNGNS